MRRVLHSPSRSELATPAHTSRVSPSTLSAGKGIVPENHSYTPFPLTTDPDSHPDPDPDPLDQARIAAGKVDKLRHVLATARVLLSIRSEAEVVEVRAPAPARNKGKHPCNKGKHPCNKGKHPCTLS